MPHAAETPDSKPLDTDAKILRIAAGQHGVASRDQLRHAGVPEHAIDYRIGRGRLRAVFRAVYTLGPVEASRAREMAAVLACGEGAVLSHGTASAVWEFSTTMDCAGLIDVSAPRSRGGRRAGIRIHRVESLDADEVARRDGLPVTTPARTLLDLAGGVAAVDLERALGRALRTGLVTPAQIEKILARHPGRRGGPALRGLLDAVVGTRFTRSEAEARFLALVRKGGLERPAPNVVVAGFEVDFVWRSCRLVVEIDGFEYHAGRAAFERDRSRDAALVAAGFRVMRFTWRQLTRRPEFVLVQLARSLGPRKGVRGPGRDGNLTVSATKAAAAAAKLS